MRLRRIILAAGLTLILGATAHAAILGTVRGIVHDPQHRPIEGATVTLRARASAWSASTTSNANGEFEFTAVTLGDYTIRVEAPGFQPFEQAVTVAGGSAPVLHCPLELATVRQSVEVKAAPAQIDTASSTTRTTVSREEIARTPGADATNSLAMITDYVPGAVLVHDQLHVRGGHQVSWLIDGIEIPNTNIASNVGPQMDPKDIDYVEVERGGYAADYGDRTSGVFNVIPRTGFERDREAELVASYGNFHTTNDQLSFGDHTERFAYYASVNANRSDLGLMTPAPDVLHDMESGLGGFASFILNATPDDQLRLVTSLRNDHYQIPNTPAGQAAGIRDFDQERDALAAFSWVHTFGTGVLLTVSPFYHFNRANYVGGPGDTPFVLDNNRASEYAGGQATLGIVKGKHNARFGFYGFHQDDSTLFGLRATDSSGLAVNQRFEPAGNLEALFAEDHYKLASWLTLNGGMRYTHFSGLLSEDFVDPRVGAAIRVPRLGWAVRGFYGRTYQPPPLDTISGPLLNLALSQGFAFLPLHGERDQQWDVGLTVPMRGWTLDLDHFTTRAHNFFDHDVLGNSNIFLPLTIQDARIRGFEATLRSPEILRRARLHLAYSRQTVQGRGGVSGGLTDFAPPATGFFYLDHDQRQTLSGVLNVRLPWRAWAAGDVAYGSGFLNGDGPAHLPAHTTVDLSLGKDFGESWSLKITALNLANRRFLVDNSNTFGGTHYADPRRVAVELRYRFHY